MTKYPNYIVDKVGDFAEFPASKNRIGTADTLVKAKELIKKNGGYFVHYQILKHDKTHGYISVGIFENMLGNKLAKRPDNQERGK